MGTETRYAIRSSGLGREGPRDPAARGVLQETARGRRDATSQLRDVRVVTPIVLEHYRFNGLTPGRSARPSRGTCVSGHGGPSRRAPSPSSRLARGLGTARLRPHVTSGSGDHDTPRCRARGNRRRHCALLHLNHLSLIIAVPFFLLLLLLPVVIVALITTLLDGFSEDLEGVRQARETFGGFVA